MKTQNTLYLIDGIAPFFVDISYEGVINWSKIPFEVLETGGHLDPGKCERVREAFKIYVKKVSSLGFNAISLDDVAHLANFDFYPESLQHNILDRRAFFAVLFQIAAEAGLAVYLTTDLMFFNPWLERRTGRSADGITACLREALTSLFKDFAEIQGVIMRIGESDGIDVRGVFQSELVIRDAATAKYYLDQLLPLFEHFHRKLIFRTWTVGAYDIGDLIWNRQTYQAVFEGIESESLIISQKYGHTDFFRYLELNPLSAEGPHQMIVEFQTRREYEGFGEFPSFVGFEYERYRDALEKLPHFSGIMVWCQTGGWSHFRKLSFLPGGSLWNELNTAVTINLFRHGEPVAKAVERFCLSYLPEIDLKQFMVLLQESDEVMATSWYLPEYSVQNLYFRRFRIPPILWIFWDNIIIHHALRKVLRRLVRDRKKAIAEGYAGLEKIDRLKNLAKKQGLDQAIFDYQYATFAILATAREYFLGRKREPVEERLKEMIAIYTMQYPNGFRFDVNFQPVWLKKQLANLLFRFLLRRHPGYRAIDRMLIIPLTNLLFPLFSLMHKKRLPRFSRKQTMGIEYLFK